MRKTIEFQGKTLTLVINAQIDYVTFETVGKDDSERILYLGKPCHISGGYRPTSNSLWVTLHNAGTRNRYDSPSAEKITNSITPLIAEALADLDALRTEELVTTLNSVIQRTAEEIEALIAMKAQLEAMIPLAPAMVAGDKRNEFQVVDQLNKIYFRGSFRAKDLKSLTEKAIDPVAWEAKREAERIAYLEIRQAQREAEAKAKRDAEAQIETAPAPTTD